MEFAPPSPSPICHVLSTLDLLDEDRVREAAVEVAGTLTADQRQAVARLLFRSLSAHHRRMVRTIAARLGEVGHQFSTLRDSHEVN